MLADVEHVAKSAAALLDDPGMTVFTLDYLMPHIDFCYTELDVELERVGMEYVEGIALDRNGYLSEGSGEANTSSLLGYMAPGQPLATMKFPKNVGWKLVGQPDTYFQPSAEVSELDDVDPSSFGAIQWRFASGALSVTPSCEAMVLRVYFDQVSTTVVDGATGVVRGTAHILAAQVAVSVDSVRKGMETRMKINQMRAMKSWNVFKDVLNKNNQGKQVEAKAMHPRRVRYGSVNVPAPTA